MKSYFLLLLIFTRHYRYNNETLVGKRRAPRRRTTCLGICHVVLGACVMSYVLLVSFFYILILIFFYSICDATDVSIVHPARASLSQKVGSFIDSFAPLDWVRFDSFGKYVFICY